MSAVSVELFRSYISKPESKNSIYIFSASSRLKDKFTIFHVCLETTVFLSPDLLLLLWTWMSKLHHDVVTQLCASLMSLKLFGMFVCLKQPASILQCCWRLLEATTDSHSICHYIWVSGFSYLIIFVAFTNLTVFVFWFLSSGCCENLSIRINYYILMKYNMRLNGKTSISQQRPHV